MRGRRDPSESAKRMMEEVTEYVIRGEGRWRGETKRGSSVYAEAKCRKTREGRGDLRVKRLEESEVKR